MITSRQVAPNGTTAVSLTEGTSGARRVFARIGGGSGAVYLGGPDLTYSPATGSTVRGGIAVSPGENFPEDGAGLLLADGDHLYAIGSGPRVELLIVAETPAPVEV